MNSAIGHDRRELVELAARAAARLEGKAARLEGKAARLEGKAARLEGKQAKEIIEWVVTESGERFCVTSSFADAVLVHLASRFAPGIDVLFLDTGLHFTATLRVRDLVQRTLPVRVRSIRPRQTVAEQDQQYGPQLYARNPDQRCALRKVVSFAAEHAAVKVAPLAAWTQADVDTYIARYDVPVNELIHDGYPSIGCRPCTRRVLPGEDPRSGRWPQSDKTECGIHR